MFFLTELKYTLKRGVAKSIIFFSFWIYIFAFLSFFDSNLIAISGQRINVIEFVGLMLYIGHSSLIVVILVISLSSNLFFQQYKQGQIALYKGINKKKVYCIKELVIYSVYFIYIFLFSINCFLLYYFFFGKTFEIYLSIRNSIDIFSTCLFLFFIILSDLIYINIGTTLSFFNGKIVGIIGLIVYVLLERMLKDKYICQMFFIDVYSNNYKNTIIFFCITVFVFAFLKNKLFYRYYT